MIRAKPVPNAKNAVQPPMRSREYVGEDLLTGVASRV